MQEQKKKVSIKNWVFFLLLIALFGILFIFRNELNSIANEYEKFFIAFSGLAYVFVASVAIWYSMQANKKQREFQADLQIRQIKLDSYNLRYECWNALQFLYELMVRFENYMNNYKSSSRDQFIKVLLRIYGIKNCNFNDDNDECFLYILQLVVKELKEYRGIKKLNDLPKINFIIEDKEKKINTIIDDYVKLTVILALPEGKKNYEGIFSIIESFVKNKNEVEKMIKELEKDLDISELHKIPNKD